MIKNPMRFLPAFGMAAVLLVACGKSDNAVAVGDTDSPEAAVMSTVKLLREGDFKSLAHTALPPAEYAKLAAEWQKKTADADEISDEDRRKFDEQMAKFTSPDCAASLYADAEPALDEFATKYKAQLPMYIGMGQTMAATGIDQAETLNAAQKQQAKDALAALAQWVQTTDWGDKAKAKQALEVVCATARKLDLKSLDQARALSFDQVLDKYGEVWGGTTKVLALYGFDLDAALDSMQVKTVSKDGDRAVVATTVTLFGKPITSETKMLKRDGHWYNEDLLLNLDREIDAPDADDADAG